MQKGELVQAGEVRLYSRTIGKGQSCVLLHGSFVDGSFWEEQMATLGRDFRTVVPDLRGHGLSDKPIGEYTPEVMAKDIRNLLMALGIEGASLLGHSMGARIALQFALDYPKLVRKIVLASGAAGPIRNRQDIFPKHIKEEIGIGTPSFDLKKFNYYEIWYSFANPSPHKVDEILQKVLKTPKHVKSSIASSFPQTDLRPRLSDIKVPALVIIGERDVICPIEEAEYLAHNLPKARLEIVPESGHCLPIEQPVEFDRKVVSFLKECPYSNASDLSNF